ncbi:MAG: hypothetical protein M3Z09_00700 [Acidobacteriota bacterium]|nr:hypothetical protein [Acidobacteriota bacterium]
MIDRAAASGYTGIVMWDTGINVLQYSWWNSSYMKQVIQYARAKGLKVMPQVAPYGHSSDMLRRNPNWAEGEPVVGTRFQVDSDGRNLHIVNSFPGLVNGGFESGKTAWFGYGDAGAVIDTSVTHSGTASGLISGALNGSANARLFQKFAVQPWRQYHMRMFTKTQNFQGYAQVLAFGDDNLAFNRVNVGLSTPANQDWTQWDYTFNSGNHTVMSILMGVWGGNQGNLWFDDISLEETALVYVVRGAGNPVSVYDPGNPGRVYTENSDYGAIADPKFAVSPVFDDYWHAPMTVPVPRGSALTPGQTVAMDWYAVQPVYGDAGASLTDPDVWQWMTDNAGAVGKTFPDPGGFFLGYDEIRNMNSSASAKAKNMTAGQLLAWHFGQTYNLFRGINPSAPIYVWNDMFDPYHNAVNNYYLVEGDLAGSWQGLPQDVIVMNWNLGNLTNSANWFSGTNPQQPVPHKQIVAGYYDSGDGAAAAATELAQVRGIPGIIGMMYTTWSDDYSQLEKFAATAKANWPGTPARPGAATFVKSDLSTQGNWKTVYGQDGYAVAADSTAYPAYAAVTRMNDQSAVWAASTNDVRALQQASSTGRIASTWFSTQPVTLDINFNDATLHSVAVYCLDWDRGGRAETIDVLDFASGAVLDSQKISGFQNGQYLVWNLTGHVIIRATRTAGNNAVVSGLFFGAAAAPDFSVSASPFSRSVVSGTAATYTISSAPANGFNGTVALNVSGLPSAATAGFSPATLAASGASTLTVTTAASTPAGTYPLTVTGSSGAAVHTVAVTLVVTAPVKGTTAVFLKSDAVTQGNWKNVYGAGGYAIPNDSVKYPSYAQVAFTNQWQYTWSPSTPDVRALLKPATTDRIASTWYAGSFIVDVNLADGNAHQVGIYCLDWDRGSRSETIDILDAATGVILDTRKISAFTGGQYLIWNLSGHVKMRVTANSGNNAVVSGLFFN